MSRAAAPCLLIDAGNSRIKWALVAADGTRLHAGAADHANQEAQDTAPNARLDFADWATLPAPGGAWISNVAGEAVARRLDAALDARWPGLAR
ncbi:MAG: type III pantothenate kinase, partial [Paraburkholderia tropica]